jgi:hypothetical protein
MGWICRDHDVIKNRLFNYYKQLLGIKSSTWVTFNEDIRDEHENVLSSKNISLTASFSEEKIKAAIFSMNPNKVPGPDGIFILFYQKL